MFDEIFLNQNSESVINFWHFFKFSLKQYLIDTGFVFSVYYLKIIETEIEFNSDPRHPNLDFGLYVQAESSRTRANFPGTQGEGHLEK